MSVSLVLLALMAVLFACGIYLMLERSMTRVLIGFLLLGNGVNLLILIMAGGAGVAPFVGGATTAARLADPLPQAFILTSIVITFGVSAFLLALIYRSWRLAQADRVEDDDEDIAIGHRTISVEAGDADSIRTDTEFGTRAEAAVTGSINLYEPDDSGTEGQL
jgi:multicomponent Na+:H+ antiporter subunit C